MTISPYGQLLASGSSDSIVRLLDAKMGAQQRTLRGHSDWVDAVAFSSDGWRIASSSFDGTVQLWDAETGTQQQDATAVRDA